MGAMTRSLPLVAPAADSVAEAAAVLLAGAVLLAEAPVDAIAEVDNAEATLVVVDAVGVADVVDTTSGSSAASSTTSYDVSVSAAAIMT
jgi:hypothetical protein